MKTILRVLWGILRVALSIATILAVVLQATMSAFALNLPMVRYNKALIAWVLSWLLITSAISVAITNAMLFKDNK